MHIFNKNALKYFTISSSTVYLLPHSQIKYDIIRNIFGLSLANYYSAQRELRCSIYASVMIKVLRPSYKSLENACLIGTVLYGQHNPDPLSCQELAGGLFLTPVIEPCIWEAQ